MGLSQGQRHPRSQLVGGGKGSDVLTGPVPGVWTTNTNYRQRDRPESKTALIRSPEAIHGKMVWIAVLSIIGGNVAPLVMGDSGAPHFTFMVYLLASQVVA